MKNLLKKVLILGCCTMVILNSSGCGKEGEKATDQEKQENATEEEGLVTSEKQELKDVAEKDFMISTEYIPEDYRNNALIVQRSEEIELYGVVNNKGEVILEPEYDRLWFKKMNDEYYIAAELGDDFGIFDINGKEYIPFGEYDKIVTAGDIGWLAQKGDRQVLLDEDGKMKKELNGTYHCVCGDNYLFESTSDTQVNGVKVNANVQIGDAENIAGDTPMTYFSGNIYDLDENLLFKGDDVGIEGFINAYAKDMIHVITKENSIAIVDSNGKIVCNLSDENIGGKVTVKEIDKDNKILIACFDKDGTYLYYQYNLVTGEKEPIEKPEGKFLDWDSQVVTKKAGDFYQFYNLEGEEIIEGRYADYDTEDDVIYLENIDSQWGIIDYSGKVIIPFGELEERDGDYFYQGKEVEDVLGTPGDGMHGFYIKNEELFEFYSFQVNK